MRTTAERVTRWERAAQTRWGAYLSDGERRALMRACSMTKPGTALDIGCGSGRWSLMLRQAGWRLICADIDEEALELCQERMPDAVCVRVQETDVSLPAEDEFIQLLAAIEVPHVVEQDWFPSEAARVLALGGFLVATYHNSRSLRGFAYRRLPRRHSFYTGPPYSMFRTALVRAGVEPLHEEGLGWLPFPRESDSPLIPILTRVEEATGVRRLPSVSPFVVLLAQKRRA